MDATNPILFACIGASLGAFAMWAYSRVRLASLLARRDLLEQLNGEQAHDLALTEHELTTARDEISRQRERLSHYEARLADQATQTEAFAAQLSSTFKLLSHEALKSNTEQFAAQFNATARALLEQLHGQHKAHVDSGHSLLGTIGRSISDKLTEVDRTVKDLEKIRISSDAELRKQLENLTNLNQFVGTEASRLSQALTNSRVQGVWGEVQLRNVVEAAGMLPYCDFVTQDSTVSEAGDGLRPDMRVRLPNNFNVLIDAKAPTKCFIEALNAPSEKERKSKLDELASGIRGHIRTMGKRNYPAHFSPALEYTLVFLPSESLFVAALEHDKELLTYAETQKVILTTPLSLIAFLRAVACGWTNVKVQENAEQIQKLGKELFARLNRFYDRFSTLGRDIDSVVKGYNEAAATARTLTSTRKKFAELGAGDPSLVEAPEEIATEIRITDGSLADYEGVHRSKYIPDL